MSLQNNVQCPGNELDGAVEKMEAAAVEFNRKASMADNQGAREVYEGLDEETRRYVRESKYGWRLEAVLRFRG
jgi:hypothetical protein